MSEISLRQSTRLYILITEITILCFASFLAFNQWIPPSGNKGFWFYAAMLSLLLGSRIITPFFHKPADVISYSIPAFIALFLVNDWPNWKPDERIVFTIASVYCVIAALASFVAILTKDNRKAAVVRVSNTLRVLVDIIGSPRAIFSFVMLFALYVFHREAPRELIWISMAWFVTVALSPMEMIVKLFKRLRLLWSPEFPAEILGEVVAYQNPGIILIRQKKVESPMFGRPLLINDPHSPGRIALALDYIGRDEGMLLRGISLNASLTNNLNPKAFENLPENVVVGIDKANIKCEDKRSAAILDEMESFVGIVAPEASIERLYFEVIKEDDLEEGRLIKTFIGNKQVLYQIVNGLTKEEIVHQKNTYGYARAQAQKIGIWDENEKRFIIATWLPKLNTPVFLKSEESFRYSVDAIGHFPKSNYTVGIKNIHELVTHNTAILGILGIGKSMLSIELVERIITAGIKVICLDLTNQYAKELSDFYDLAYDKSRIQTIIEAGYQDQNNWNEDPEKGGSIPNFLKAIYDDLQEFFNPINLRMLKIYNPSQLFATKQISEPKSFNVGGQWHRKAALWTISPVEVTRIISECALSLLQDEMTDKARACLIYEEAHSLVPEWNTVAVEGDKIATSGTARAILQGRKYGLGCLLISQRTANVTKTILNQCNTIFAMRSFDETGKEFLSNYIGKDYTSILSSLPERHAVFCL